MDRPNSTPRYPVLLDIDGAPCLVVGGGPVAARKVRGLLAAGAVVTVVAPLVHGTLVEPCANGSVRWEQRLVSAQDLESTPWRFVVVATDDKAVNARVAAQATALGIWANNASESDGGPAALPAVHRQGPVTLTVSTGGSHPGAAAWLRDLAAGAIGPEYIVALDLITEATTEATTAGPAGHRVDWRQLVQSGMLDLIRDGRTAEAKERLQGCL